MLCSVFKKPTLCFSIFLIWFSHCSRAKFQGTANILFLVPTNAPGLHKYLLFSVSTEFSRYFKLYFCINNSFHFLLSCAFFAYKQSSQGIMWFLPPTIAQGPCKTTLFSFYF